MSRKYFERRYTKITCQYCGMLISGNGLAQYSHYMKHQREKQKKQEQIKSDAIESPGVFFIDEDGPAELKDIDKI